jgi:small subunit ribosomal protein S14
MKYLGIKDKNRREQYFKLEKERLILKYLLRKEELKLADRLVLTKQLENLPKDSSITRLRNRCVVTNRGRGVIQKFKLSRLQLKELFSLGLVPGWKKSIW